MTSSNGPNFNSVEYFFYYNAILSGLVFSLIIWKELQQQKSQSFLLVKYWTVEVIPPWKLIFIPPRDGFELQYLVGLQPECKHTLWSFSCLLHQTFWHTSKHKKTNIHVYAYRYEAVELRDGDKSNYLGKSVHKAVANVNEKIAIALVGMDPTQQAQIDKLMIDLDKTENKVLFSLIVYLSFDSSNVSSWN